MYTSLKTVIVTLLFFISIGCIYSNVQIRETEKVDHDNGNIFTLAKLNVQCLDNEVLSYWRVISRDGKMQIQYYCISGLSVLITKETRYTVWNKTNENKRKSVNFLDRHRVLCNQDEAIGAFQMEKSESKIRFRFRCNKVKYTNVKDRVTAWEKANFGEIDKLDVHQIYGPEYKNNLQAIRGWRMRTKYVNRWCTFTCDSFQFIKFEIFYSDLANFNEHDDDLDGLNIDF